MRKSPAHLINGVLLICCWLISGCHIYTATYTHPLYGGSTSYKTMPLRSDSVHTALYASAGFTRGNSNDLLRDRYFHFSGNIYQAHQFSFFHVYYGANIHMGSYKVKPYHSAIRLRIDTAFINNMAGDKSFGAWGSQAGFTVTVPLRSAGGRYRGEWRILGVHGSLQNEFGDYLWFRRQLDSSHVTRSVHNHQLKTLGLSSEWAFTSGKGSLNMLFQYNFLLGREYQYKIYSGRYPGKYRYGYFSAAFNFSVHNYSPFFQLNLGREMISTNIGLNYRLAGFKKKKSG
ncbi:MAG: hypothetical protein KF746_06550 [Chitinophagaceae bacterium]|nr:hypothetical protein [Chitinophagaceae bacterium]